jgi:hypothetical protein
MKKVYCKTCKFYKKDTTTFAVDVEYCKHPNNIITLDSYYHNYVEYRGHPIGLNRNNDCQWYKPTIIQKICEFIKEII